MSRSRRITRLNALDYAAKLTSKDFDDAFCRIAGWIETDAEYCVGAAYPVEEVAELFKVLFNMRGGANDETPAAGTAGGSGTTK